METDVQEHLKYCLLAMRFLATHPDIPRNLTWVVRIILCYGTIMSIVPVLMHNVYLNILKENFSDACQYGIFCFTFFGVSLNNFIMFYYRKNIKRLLDLMKSDYILMKELPLEEQMIYQTYMKKEQFLCKQWYFITIFAMGLFNAKAVILMLYYYIIGEMRLVNQYELIYPEFIERRKDEVFVFICLYCLILYCGFYACVNNLSFIPLGPIFMLHACGLLEAIKSNIDHLYDGVTDDVNERLNEIVKKLQYTYNFVKLANVPFRLFYDATLNLSSIMLPITFFALLQSISRGEPSLEFSSFIWIGVLMSSTPTYYSDLLLEKGEEVSMAIFSCGWERQYDQRVHSTILILLIRATRPIALRTMFKTLCLEALADMFRQAYAIFSLMSAVME